MCISPGAGCAFEGFGFPSLGRVAAPLGWGQELGGSVSAGLGCPSGLVLWPQLLGRTGRVDQTKLLPLIVRLLYLFFCDFFFFFLSFMNFKACMTERFN